MNVIYTECPLAILLTSKAANNLNPVNFLLTVL